MKIYVCRACDDWSDECTACVSDTTPDIFDKTIMDRLCKHYGNTDPCWLRRKYVHEFRL